MPTHPDDKWYHVKPRQVERLAKILQTIVDNVSDDNERSIYMLSSSDDLDQWEMLREARAVLAEIDNENPPSHKPCCS